MDLKPNKDTKMIGRCAHCCAEVLRYHNEATKRAFHFCLDIQHTLETEGMREDKEVCADPCLVDSLETCLTSPEGVIFWHTGIEEPWRL